DLAEIGIAKGFGDSLGEEEAEGAQPLRGQGPGDGVGHVVELGDYGHYPGIGLRGDAAGIVQGEGNGGLGYPRAIGDVGNGRTHLTAFGSLYRASDHALDDRLLRDEEEYDDRNHRHENGGEDQVPLLDVCPGEIRYRQGNGHDPIALPEYEEGEEEV